MGEAERRTCHDIKAERKCSEGGDGVAHPEYDGHSANTRSTMGEKKQCFLGASDGCMTRPDGSSAVQCPPIPRSRANRESRADHQSIGSVGRLEWRSQSGN